MFGLLSQIKQYNGFTTQNRFDITQYSSLKNNYLLKVIPFSYLQMLQNNKKLINFLLNLWFSRIVQFWSYWRFVVNLMLSLMLSRFNHHSLTCTNIALASFPVNQKQWKIRWSIHGKEEKGSNPFTPLPPLISAHHRKMRKVVLFSTPPTNQPRKAFSPFKF